MASNKYLDFTGLSHFLDKIKSIFAPKKQGVEYINGTQTAATGTGLARPQITSCMKGR